MLGLLESTERFIRECSWDQHLRKEREGSTVESREKFPKTPRGALKLSWLFTVRPGIEYGLPWEGAMASGKVTGQCR